MKLQNRNLRNDKVYLNIEEASNKIIEENNYILEEIHQQAGTAGNTNPHPPTK